MQRSVPYRLLGAAVLSNRHPTSDVPPIPPAEEGAGNSVIPMAVHISVAVPVVPAVVAGLVIVQSMGYGGGATFKVGTVGE